MPFVSACRLARPLLSAAVRSRVGVFHTVRTFSAVPEPSRTSNTPLFVEEDDVVNLTKELIAFKSVNPPGQELPCAEFVAQWATDRGMEAEVVPVDDGVHDDRANVVVTLKGGSNRNGRAPLMYSGHLDVVNPGQDWTKDPFNSVVEDGLLYGRGASDMKGGIAAMLTGMARLKETGMHEKLAGDLVFVGTAGEEDTHIGAIQFLKHPAASNTSGIIISEPTSSELVVCHKGRMWAEFTTYGRTGHASTPQVGINAISHMAKAVAHLDRHEWVHKVHNALGSPTFVVSMIEGGLGPNMIPDKCSIQIDIRLVPGQTESHMMNEFEEIIAELQADIGPEFKHTLDVKQLMSAMQTAPEDPFVAATQQVASEIMGEKLMPVSAPYYTDGSVLQSHTNVPVIIFGPGDLHQAHVPDEWVRVKALKQGADFFANFPLLWLEKQ